MFIREFCKFCIILVISSNAYAQSWTKPLNEYWQPDSGIVGMIYNAVQYHTTKLSGHDQLLHSRAVYLALDHAQPGQVVEWVSDRSDSLGKVQIAVTWDSSGDTCHKIYHYVYSNRRDRSWGETACMNNTSGRWVFSDK
jgi:surface antigen